jgi:hypothetical protein
VRKPLQGWGFIGLKKLRIRPTPLQSSQSFVYDIDQESKYPSVSSLMQVSLMKSIFCFFIASLTSVSSFSQSVVSFNDNRDPVSTKITGFKDTKLFTDDGTFKTGNVSLVVS